MSCRNPFIVSWFLLGALTCPVHAAGDDAEDLVQGDWSASATGASVVQVVALGDGRYRAHVLADRERREPPVAVLIGQAQADQVVFTGAPKDQNEKGGAWWPAPDGSQAWSGTLAGGRFTLRSGTGVEQQLGREARVSPTMGEKPPAGAAVLLGPDTTDAGAEWIKQGSDKPCPWKLLPGGVLQCDPGKGSIISRREFASHHLHLEFRLPFEPGKRGQNRGNSGVYFQGRYEVQVLDSYGLQGVDNECGGIYRNAKPQVNRCLPPGRWQTYDADFTAAMVEGEGGQVKKKARITVRHNGGVIHQDQELSDATTAAPNKVTGKPAGLYLQDHGHQVEYRNIWIVPTTP